MRQVALTRGTLSVDDIVTGRTEFYEETPNTDKSERARAVYESREKMRRENDAYEEEIRMKAKIEVAKNLVKMALPYSEIIKATELPRAIVEGLMKIK